MKRSCGVCGNEFDGYRNEKYCPTCKAEGKKLCSMCGKVIQAAKNRYYCPECERVLWQKQHKAAAKKAKSEARTAPLTIDEKAKAAKAAGMSYGKYTAMMRGMLRV
jgi:transposase-like protein